MENKDKKIEALESRIKDLEEEIDGTKKNENIRRRLIAHDLKSPLNSINSSVELTKLNLYEKEKNIDIIRTTEPHNEEIAKRTSEAFFLTRKNLKKIEDIIKYSIDLISGINCEAISKEELERGAKEISPISRTQELIESYEHRMLTRDLGLTFDYVKHDLNKKINISPYAFSAIISNAVSNSMKYAKENSVVKIANYFEKNKFVFELENMVNSPINIEEALRRVKHGYTPEEIENKAIYEINEGIGLSHVINIIDNLGAEREISSDNFFKITDERTKNLERKTYGIILPESNVPELPSFYFKVYFPISPSK